MVDMRKKREMFCRLLGSCSRVTVLSHINPDADALGTALGIYHLLKKDGKSVEVVNATADLPAYLDFMPEYGKIKTGIGFSDSLIISCDCSSIDRTGFDISGRKIVNIDHHATNTDFGTLNIVDKKALSSAEVAYELLEPIFDIDKETAVAFYAALISDTRYFTVRGVTGRTFALAMKLIEKGADPAFVAGEMIQRRSLASIRILGKALESLEMKCNGRVAVMTIRQGDLDASGARQSDLDGIVDYARSLITVELAVMIVEHPDHIKVSLRSKGANGMAVASAYGGGGHRCAGGFEIDKRPVEIFTEELIGTIIDKGVLQDR
jgi:phosphoesterase RecJ-like protein